MTVIATLKDGRFLSREAIAAVVIAAAGEQPVTVTMTDHRKVEYVVQYNFTTDPDTRAIPHDATITDNVVGVTVYVAAGTTLSGEVISLGI